MKKSLTLRLLVCIALIVVFNNLCAQKEMINKQIPSRTNFKQLSGDVALKDRFGNLYHPNEIAIKTNPSVTSGGSSGGSTVSFAMPFPIKDSCTSGMFKLHFVQEPVSGTGFSLAAHRDVICEVYRDISRLIENQSGSSAPYINLMVASDTSITVKNSGISLPSGVNIVGTSFEPIKYNLKNAWMDNIIYTSIKNGKSAYTNLMGMDNQLHSSFYNYTHGLLIVNFKNKTWYTNFNDTSSIPSNQDDLYTHTLQQALHMLGLSSNILQNGNARGGNNLYARYDNYLYKNTSSSKLFTYSSSTKQITNTTTLPSGCSSPNDVRFIGDSSNIHVYNDTPWNTNINLSNFSCAGSTCNTNYAKPNNYYVMVPCLQSGQTYIKRHPHQDEVYALCDLGYKLKAVSGVYAFGANISNNASQGNVYKTYSSCTEPCIAVGGHDTIVMDTVRACTRTFSTKILTNDIPSSSIIPRMELLDTSQGTLTFNTTGFTFTPKPHFKYGEVRIVYFPQCNASAQPGNATYITIRYPYPPLPPCIPNDDCNYICYGTFEESDDPNLWHGFLIYEPIFDYNTADLWNSTGAVTCRRNVIDNYWADCNVVGTGCEFNSYGVHPHINGGNQFMGIYAESGASVYTEGFHFKLKKPIYHDTTKRLKLKFLAKVFNGCASNFKMIAVADDTLPQPPPNPIRPLVGGVRTCAQFCDTLGTLDITSDTWAYYSIPIALPKAGDSFTDVIIMSDVALDTAEPNILQHYCYFDNFEIYDSLATRAVIASNPHSLIPCNDTTQTIEYYVCLENSIGVNSDSIIVQVNLPYGFTIASGSDFNATGRYKIPSGAISNAICDTLKLKYTIDYTKVATDRGHTITAGYSCNAYCVSEISDWVKVFPKNHDITVTKSVNKPNPIVGDTIIFTYVVSNISPLAVSDILFTDTFPSQLIPIQYQSGPTLNGQLLSYQISLDSAFSITSPSFIQFSTTAVVKSNCKIPTQAQIKSIANPCFKAQTSLNLNDTSSGSPVVATIKPLSAIWCGNNIPLQAVITNPSGTYTYQWQKDGTNVGSNSASHLATSNGLYGVKISQNGCSSVASSRAFDTALIVTDTVTHARCVANIGSIYVTPRNGVKPYTYSWSGASSVTDSFRTGLTNGTYTVTVTDSIGCTKVHTKVVNRIMDTLILYKTVKHPICTAINGSISVASNGGTAPHSYLWNGGATTLNRTGLNANTYYLTVTDNNGCELKDTTTLTTIQFNIQLNPTLVHPQCGLTSGSIVLNPSGGYNNFYTYLWSNASTAKDRTNLPTGTYKVTVTDTFGCNKADSFVINSLPDTSLKSGDSILSTLCFANSGAIYLQPTGTAPFRYLWSTGDTIQNLINIDSGFYTVRITDSINCVIEDTFYVPRDLDPIQFSLLKDANCITNLATVTIFPLTGHGQVNIQWIGGDTSRVRDSLTPTGTYSFWIFDSIGCFDSIAITNIFENPITIDKGVYQTYCGFNRIQIDPTSGTPPYTFIWDDQLVWGDSIRTNLTPGTYIVAITDSTGCITYDTTTLRSDPNPSILDAYIQVKSNCLAGDTSTLKAIILAGNSSATYQWSTGATTPMIKVTNLSTKYTVTITEPSGCQRILSQIPHPDSFLKLGDGYGGNGFADINSAISTGRLSSTNLSKQSIKIKGTFTINSNTDFRYCNIVLDEGARIDVPSDCNGNSVDNLTMLNNLIYTCGTKLAHGITIRECSNNGNVFGFNLNFTNNEIRDCYKGLEIRRSMIPTITNNLFEDNLIGLHVFGDDINVCTPFPKSIILPTYLSIHGNKFRGSGTTQTTGKVKIPYNGIVLNQYTKFRPTVSTSTAYGVPLAGIIVENTRTLQLGHGNAASNIFENMNNGILAYGSELYVYNTLFRDMLYKASTPIREYAVYAEGNRFTQKGSLIFGGYSSNALPHISNVLNGIYTTEHQNTNVSGVYFSGVTYGVVTEVNHSYILNKTLTVKNCKFEGSTKPAYVGVDIIDNSLDRFSAVVEQNTFSNVITHSVRALKNTLSFDQSSLYVENNIIKGDAHRGIYLLNYPTASKNQLVRVQGNNCRFTTNAMRYGIHYYNCGNIIDKENTVKGFSPTYGFSAFGTPSLPIGQYYENTTGSFSCNLLDSVFNGVRFFGNCDASTWSKNNIRNHRLGLRLDTLSTLKDHYWAGNTFSGTCFREAQSNQARPTTFYYSNFSSQYLPNPRFPNATTNQWWFFLTNPNGVETNNCSPFASTGGWVSVPIGNKGDIIVKDGGGGFRPIGKNTEPVFGIEMTTTDTAILINNMVFGDFEPELTWQYRKDLYDKIKPYEFELRDTSIFRDYLAQMEDGSINEFTQINVIDRNAYHAAQAYATQVIQLKTAIDSAWEELYSLDSAYKKAIDSISLASIKQARTQLRSWIWTQDTLFRNLLAHADTAYQSEIQQIQIISDSIIPECISDSLRNVFLAIYYQTYGQGQTVLNNVQIQTYTSLANRCPFEQLDGVYRSRGILWSRGDTTIYNDSILCAPLGITLKALKPIKYEPVSQKRQLSFSLFPNPTSDKTNIHLSYIPDLDLTFIVTDVLGRELYRESKYMNTNRHVINTNTWIEGIYMLRIVDEKEIVFKSHIQVIK